MAELIFETDQYGTHAVVDGLEIAHYTDIGEGRVRVYVDGHKHPLCFRRHAVADSERQARHWIRTWWARDRADILAGLAKLDRERKAQAIENQDPAILWRTPEMEAASARPKRVARRRPPRL